MPDLPTFWQITGEETALLSAMEQAETDEEREAIAAQLEEIIAAHYQKVDRIEAVFRTLERRQGALEGEIAALKADLAKLDARRKRRAQNAERLEQYVIACMERAGVREIEGDTVTFKLGAARGTVEIVDESLVPDEYRKRPDPPPPLKSLIGAALKNGKDVPGAQLREGGHVLRRS